MGLYLISSNVAKSGKTTLATQMTQTLSNDQKTILLDIDEKKSAYHWATQNSRQFDYEHLIFSEDDHTFLKNRIDQLKKYYQHIVIDADGKDTPALRSILMGTDKLIIPVKNLQQDFHLMNELIQIAIAVKQINTDLQIYVVMNHQTTSLVQDQIDQQRSLLEELPIHFLNTLIYEDADYVTALQEGQHIWQLNQHAAEVFDQFMQELHETAWVDV